MLASTPYRTAIHVASLHLLWCNLVPAASNSRQDAQKPGVIVSPGATSGTPGVGPDILRRRLPAGISHRHWNLPRRSQQGFGNCTRGVSRAGSRCAGAQGRSGMENHPSGAAPSARRSSAWVLSQGAGRGQHIRRRPSPAQSRWPAKTPRPRPRSAAKFCRCHGQKIRVVSQRILPKAHDFYIVQIGYGGRKPAPAGPASGQRRRAVGGQPVGAAVQADQQRVAGGACLKHIQLPLHLVGVGQAAVQLQKGRLGQTGQGFCGRSAPPNLLRRLPRRPASRTGRQRAGSVPCGLRPPKSGTLWGVANGGNGRQYRSKNALVSRAGQNYAFCLRMGGQRRFHRGGRHTAVHAKGGIHRRGQVVGSQAPPARWHGTRPCGSCGPR